MPGRGPSPDQVERFRGDLHAIAPAAAAARFGFAVSGGPDSLALLLLAHAAFAERIEVATVDHGLRKASAGEAALVADHCRHLGVRHSTLRPEAPIEGSVQTAARAERYRLLEEWRSERGLDHVLTAHHADDQAETLLMRLNRGAGVAGLSGVRAVNGALLRPLLGWRRSELAAIVEEAGLAAVDDPSNADERFDRARLRARLATADWVDPAGFARSAGALAAAEAALEWTADRLAEERLSACGAAFQLQPDGLPAELRRRLLLRALRRLDAEAAPRGEELSRLLATLEQGGTATLAGVKCLGGALWRFERAPPRRSG
ncbi:MAG TPA: tRNA lysidine(34) synthetase TilS [Allosphingosinicella sp.]|nr:tRNA lysidine(34) synthetase TilS [Allosphingosinicella sp.]